MLQCSEALLDELEACGGWATISLRGQGLVAGIGYNGEVVI